MEKGLINAGRHGLCCPQGADSSKVNRDGPDALTPGWTQASPHGASRGSLQRGERRRGTEQQAQVEPHPRPCRRKPNHAFQQGKAPGNLLSRLLPTPCAHALEINQVPTTPTQLRALPSKQLLCQRTPGPEEAAKGKLDPPPSSPQLQCRLFDELEHHVLGHLSSFGCHQPEVNRFCSSNKPVTKATVLIPKCN